jgi:hypothetical protein
MPGHIQALGRKTVGCLQIVGLASFLAADENDEKHFFSSSLTKLACLSVATKHYSLVWHVYLILIILIEARSPPLVCGKEGALACFKILN